MAVLRTIRTMAEEDVLHRFGERVRQLRKDAGWSQEEFAAASELDRSYMGGIERGQRNVALRNIEAIAVALKMTISDLLDGV